MDNTLILGLGNPLRGDDGFGSAVVTALRDAALSPQIKLIDGGTPGLEIILIWQGYDRVFIVDTADMGLGPGIWRRFRPEETTLSQDQPDFKGNLHSIGMAEAFVLAEALDMLPRELIIYGIQPAKMDWCLGLSSEVKKAVQIVCESILHELPGDDLEPFLNAKREIC